MDAVNNPEDESAGTRRVPFSRELYVEYGTTSATDPPQASSSGSRRAARSGFGTRTSSGDVGVGKDSNGQDVLRCTYDPETRGGYAPDGRKVRGTIHWVSARHALPAAVRLYEHLFSVEHPEDVPARTDYKDGLQNVEERPDSRVEPSLAGAVPGADYQFERRGYLCVDPDSTGGDLVCNRTVGLRDTWVKILKKQSK